MIKILDKDVIFKMLIDDRVRDVVREMLPDILNLVRAKIEPIEKEHDVHPLELAALFHIGVTIPKLITELLVANLNVHADCTHYVVSRYGQMAFDQLVDTLRQRIEPMGSQDVAVGDVTLTRVH